MPQPEMVPSVPETPPAPAPEATPATPSEPKTEGGEPQNPPAPQEPQTPAQEVAKFKLPDGREVTPEELYDLHVNKLLPDYTQKSQKLSALEKVVNPTINNPEVPEWKKPDYAPKSWDEVLETAAKLAEDRLLSKAQAEEKRQQEVVGLVDQQIAEIKKTDPSVDENALFLHANKYGFRDLVQAHGNMKAMKQVEVDAEQRTLKNLKARGETPVSGTPGVTVQDGTIDPNVTRKFGSALDYFRSLKS